MKRPAAASCLAALLLAAPALAHERSVSHLRLVEDRGGVGVLLRIDARELTRLAGASADSTTGSSTAGDRLLVDALGIERAGRPCAVVAPPRREPSAAGRVLLRWRMGCPVEGPMLVRSTFAEVLGAPHLTFVRVDADGRGPREAVLHGDRPRWEVPSADDVAAKGPAAAALDAVLLGVEHIASGTDHLAFVLGLLLAASALGEVAVLVTAFTAAHTLTLGLATLGFLRPLPSAVEPMIALSIAIVAVENLAAVGAGTGATGTAAGAAAGTAAGAATGTAAGAATGTAAGATTGTAAGAAIPPRATAAPAPRLAAMLLLPALVASAAGLGRVPLAALAGISVFAVSFLALAGRHPGAGGLRWVVAFVFGLLHGMGFASALAESGFAEGSAFATLLGFNAGVEIGQLVFVVLLWPLLGLARRRLGASFARAVVEPASVALLALAVAWYLARAFG